MFGVLGTHGLDPALMDSWRAWIAFKAFARLVAEAPDPGVSVQITRIYPDEPVSIILLRQVVEADDGYLEPTGGVVCELLFAAPRAALPDVEFWSFDCPSFEQFVDRVEQDPLFSELVLSPVLQSDVYWREA